MLDDILNAPSLKTAPEADRELIRRAYAFSKKAHEGQKRKSGESYFLHLEETAAIAAGWGIDAVTVAAALLHDTIEDTSVTESQLQKEFGSEVAFLVQGVTKISHIKYRGNEAQAETLKKMILALSEDIRVVFVKLADRTHNMRTLHHLPANKQERIARETAEIYAPLAYRLGLAAVSGELDDLSYRYLHPKEFAELSREVTERLAGADAYAAAVKSRLEKLLLEHRVHFVRVESRVKGIGSLAKKLNRRGVTLDSVYDLVALRVIVEKMEDCYGALGAIHATWPPLPGYIKDYVALPKPNGYRSLHTTVFCEEGKPTEFQIRTEEMHRENEFGIAANWAYIEHKGKAESAGKASFADSRRGAWIAQLREWQDKRHDPDEFLSALKVDLFHDRIFCITPRGEAIDLPRFATPVDFAYAIHTEIGDHCVGARVNGRMVQLDTRLNSGDVVEIITQKNKRPNAAWLGFVKTRHARNRIRAEIRSATPIARPVHFILTVNDRPGLLRDIMTLFTRQRITISGTETNNPKGTGIVSIRITATPEAAPKATQLAQRLEGIKGIEKAEVAS